MGATVDAVTEVSAIGGFDRNPCVLDLDNVGTEDLRWAASGSVPQLPLWDGLCRSSAAPTLDVIVANSDDALAVVNLCSATAKPDRWFTTPLGRHRPRAPRSPRVLTVVFARTSSGGESDCSAVAGALEVRVDVSGVFVANPR